MKMRIAVIVFLSCAFAYSQDVNSYVELLRSDIQTKKKAIITTAMDFTDAEATAFWPVYRSYELEANKVNDEFLTLIKDYADNFENMTDEKAKSIANQSFKLEEKELKLKKKLFKNVEKVLPAIKAARLVQIENQINRLIDVQISANLPLME